MSQIERFSSEQKDIGGTTLVEVHGELDCFTVPSLEDHMDTMLYDGHGPVVLDLRELRFMDVAGLRLAVRLEARAQLHGVDFSMLEGHGPAARVFQLTGMRRFVG